MTTDVRPWTVRLTQVAESDIQSIIVWTLREFGDLKARTYADTLSAALMAVAPRCDGLQAAYTQDVKSKVLALLLSIPAHSS
jgi:plasmid stabilization system protein ParE